MHCKHCGSQIDADSNFCSFCGGVVEPLNSLITQQAADSEVIAPIEKENQNENRLIVVGLIPLVSELFMILGIIALNCELRIGIESKLLSKILLAFIPLLLMFHVKKTINKRILLIFGLILFTWMIFLALMS